MEDHPITRMRLAHTPPYLTAAALAEAAGLRESTLSRTMAGEAVGTGQAAKLAAALGVPYETLREALPGQVPPLSEIRRRVPKEAA